MQHVTRALSLMRPSLALRPKESNSELAHLTSVCFGGVGALFFRTGA